jgi:ubiquinone/menaquinone biosynthesis C-methylase UbiE
MNKLKDIFLANEADFWFERNKKSLLNYKYEKDVVEEIFRNYYKYPKKVLEIGCSIGHRLNGIKSKFPEVEVTGVEPSIEAIKFGKNLYPQINFHNGVADSLPFFKDAEFDVVIAGFMLYVVDRSHLMRTIAEIDRVLANKGLLIVIDFFATNPVRKVYHHVKDFEAYCYKQCYEDIFLSTKFYHQIHKANYNHNTWEKDTNLDYFEKVNVSALVKDFDATYIAS